MNEPIFSMLDWAMTIAFGAMLGIGLAVGAFWWLERRGYIGPCFRCSANRRSYPRP